MSQKIANPSAERTPGLQKTAGQQASPYGCYLASRSYTDSVRVRSLYLRFPRGVVEQAETNTQWVVYRVLWIEGRTREGEGVRFAHCRIPKTGAAYELALQQVLQIGEGVDKTDESRAESKTAGSCKLREAQICIGSC